MSGGRFLKMTNPIKITFGIIVLNGEPFTRYCIRALYPHAHEIIVAEGAHGEKACINGQRDDFKTLSLLNIKPS